MNVSKMILFLIFAGSVCSGSFALAASDSLLDLNAIDSTVNPCDNFYQYACGNWLKTFSLPADHAVYNRQSDQLTNNTTENLKMILEQYAKGEVKVPAKYAKTLGTFYQSCMNTDAIEKSTPEFVKKQLARIDQSKNLHDLTMLTAHLQKEGTSVFFDFGTSPDLGDSSHYSAVLDQGGLSFLEKSYYFNQDQKSIDIRARFQKHVANLLILSGESLTQAKKASVQILKFETALAKHSLAVEDMQDSTKLDHPKTLGEVETLSPNFDWKTYFGELQVDSSGKINVSNPEFYVEFDKLWQSTKLADLKTYVKWQMLHAAAPTLSRAYAGENFAFWHQYLVGQKVEKQRWKICTESTERSLIEALGEAYVNSFQDAKEIKDRAQTMIDQIRKSFGENLAKLTWLDDETRAAAVKKLTLVKNNVGFPAKWKSYDTLKLGDSYAENSIAAAYFTNEEENARVGKSTANPPWKMGTWDQNAFYDPSDNSINFPIGSLVAPILDLNYSTGANFGSIGGGWMGHELTHGFDSDGRNYDGHGSLNQWWTPATTAAFDKSAQCLVDQANQYEVIPGVKVNGKQTLTENIADQGGIKIGYQSFLAMAGKSANEKKFGSFNQRQQYWLAYAQSWCTQESEAHLRLHVQSDVHPPAEFRVNGVLANRPEFAWDFSCNVGTKMVPAQTCQVW